MKKAKNALQEGIHYYLENGKVVFTAAYHIQRGRCCNKKCRHCPYEDGKTKLKPEYEKK